MSKSAKLDNNQFWIIDGASHTKSECAAIEQYFKLQRAEGALRCSEISSIGRFQILAGLCNCMVKTGELQVKGWSCTEHKNLVNWKHL